MPVKKKNTPVTITELKKKMKEWLSCLTKTNMMETVIMLFLGAGKKKKKKEGSLRQRAVCPCASCTSR